MTTKEKALDAHKKWGGKLEIKSRAAITNREELALAYTPGVAEPCLEIQKDTQLSYVYTRRHNTVAVVTDGTAVLGLGDIGPEAGMPVMEGKCVLFKEFGGVDAIPLCIRSKSTEEIVRTIYLLSGSFGGINLEDISAPRCFEIERRLKELCDIPIFHDDQHGTAVVVLAAVHNALKLVGKDRAEVKTVIAGAGAAGVATARILLEYGMKNVLVCNRKGILEKDDQGLDADRRELALITNPNGERGSLKEALEGADVFIGLSAPGIVSKEMIASMAADPIVFALSNPIPEIMPELALSAGAAIIGTGRSDFHNQINNVLAFPGIFRGALDCGARDITGSMKVAAAMAIAELIGEEELKPAYVLPDVFDKRVAPAVAKAVAQAWFCEQR